MFVDVDSTCPDLFTYRVTCNKRLVVIDYTNTCNGDINDIIRVIDGCNDDVTWK